MSVKRWAALVVLGTLLSGCGAPTERTSPAATPTVTVVATTVASPTPTPSTTPRRVFDRVRSGVVRLQTLACRGGVSGSGLLVAPDLVLTVAHVVEGSNGTFSVRTDDQLAQGRVVAYERDHELALLRLDRDLHGHRFEILRTPPGVGDPVIALGYPGGRPLSATTGTVSGLDRTQDVADVPLKGLVQYDAATDPGNSGGPLVDAEGRVAGLVEAGYTDEQNSNYAVSSRDARRFVAAHLDDAETVDTSTCDLPGASELDGITVSSSSPDGQDVAAALADYFRSINTRDWTTGWGRLTRTERGAYSDLAAWIEGSSTSFIHDADLVSVGFVDARRDVATVSFLTTQSQDHAPKRTTQDCSVWRIRYTMALDLGTWQIDKAVALTSPRACSTGERMRVEPEREAMQAELDASSTGD